MYIACTSDSVYLVAPTSSMALDAASQSWEALASWSSQTSTRRTLPPLRTSTDTMRPGCESESRAYDFLQMLHVQKCLSRYIVHLRSGSFRSCRAEPHPQ
jgi:hypothetical protein